MERKRLNLQKKQEQKEKRMKGSFRMILSFWREVIFYCNWGDLENKKVEEKNCTRIIWGFTS